MDVEVLGVLKNMNGPKGDIILVRLHGAKAEYTGVVAGMSGSPVYFDGKLAGALAFRIGEFSKEPIAGVTPIADMLEINALDKSLLNSSLHRAFLRSDIARGLLQSEAVQLIDGQITQKIYPPVDELRDFPEMVEGIFLGP